LSALEDKRLEVSITTSTKAQAYAHFKVNKPRPNRPSNDVDVFVVELGILHYHDDGGEGVVYTALMAESILLIAEDAVGFCIFRAYVFDWCGPKFEEIIHEGDGAVVFEEGGVTFSI
jgi:hypothetical protein